MALCAKCCGLFKFNEQIMDLVGAPGELIWIHSSGLVGERAAAYYEGREEKMFLFIWMGSICILMGIIWCRGMCDETETKS